MALDIKKIQDLKPRLAQAKSVGEQADIIKNAYPEGYKKDYKLFEDGGKLVIHNISTGEEYNSPNTVSSDSGSDTQAGRDYYSPEAIAARQKPFEGNQFGMDVAKEKAIKYAPAVVGGIATSLLGPEAGYPAYAAVGGLSQGGSRALINKMQGKNAIDEQTVLDTALGTGGGLITKPLSQIGSFLGKKAALSPIAQKLMGNKVAPDAMELAKDIVSKKSVIGPETQSSIEDLLNNEIEGTTVSKNADAIANLFNKTPTKILRANPSSGEMAEMQQEVINLLRGIEPYAKTGQVALGQTGNALNQGVGNRLYDMVKDHLTRK